jgi:ATP-dependent DNA helicase RecQ
MMARYVETRSCRWQLLLSYFGQVGDGRQRPRRRDRGRNGAARRRHLHPVDSRLTHALLGTRRVLRHEGDTMTVLFDEAGYRTSSVDLVNTNDLLQPAPDPDADPRPPRPWRATKTSVGHGGWFFVRRW